MQFISDDLKELNIILNKFSKGNPNYFVFEKPDTQLRVDSIGRKQILKQVEQLSSEYKTFGFSDSLKFKIEFHLKSIDQWIKLVTDAKTNYNFRDSCMAENINFYLLNQPNSKGMFFAHNVHVSKLLRKHPKNLIEKSTGTYLFNLIGEKYYSIAQDFNDGEILAVSFENNKSSLKSFKLTPSKKKSIGYVLSTSDKNILFCESKEIPNLNKLKMTNIGAVYGKNKFNRDIERYARNASFFDAFLFIRHTKATTFLTNK
jgi:erythromycin esterase